MGLGELPRLPRRARAPLVLARHRHAGRPRPVARATRWASGRRPRRAPDRRRARRHGADGAGRHRRRRARGHDQPHDAAPHPRRRAPRHAPLEGRRAAGARHTVDGGRSGGHADHHRRVPRRPTRASPPSELELLRTLVRSTGRPLSVSVQQPRGTPRSVEGDVRRRRGAHRRGLRRQDADGAASRSACSRASPRRSTRSPSARRTRRSPRLPLAERVHALGDPERRGRILAEHDPLRPEGTARRARQGVRQASSR